MSENMDELAATLAQRATPKVDKAGAKAGCLAALISVVTAWPVKLLEALVFSKVWGWFVEPLGAPPVRLVVALGIVLLASLIVPQARRSGEMPADKAKSIAERIYTQIGMRLALPLVIWLEAYLIHRYLA